MKNFIKSILYSTLCILLVSFVVIVAGAILNSCDRSPLFNDANATDFGIFGTSTQDYSDALNHAKDAFLQQSGLQSLQDNTLNYIKNTAQDQYDWTKKIGAIVGGGYYVYKHQSMNIPLTHDCKLTLAIYSLGIQYHF